MKKIISADLRENEIKYERYRKIIRSLRGGKVEKINSKKTGSYIAKK
ncbi:hypothetical protein [Anaeroselena agilis]|uniref:Uncharacterized protein n=1 Tax=Anaeroselena agilis TaxID=3063788 RepID=A0ABU3NZ14_9FIRM|nr:hypothetical protein [Selenomonadales bacterium 4137-cl]